MRILIIISEFSVGGAEQIISSLVRGLSDDNSITLLSFNTVINNPIFQTISDKVNVVSLSKEKSSRLPFFTRIAGFFSSNRNFDIILCNLQPAAYYLGLMLPVIKCPVIYILHNDYPLLKNQLKRFILRNFCTSSKVTLVSVSEQIASGFNEKFRLRPLVITNGILPPQVTTEIGSVVKQIESFKKDKSTKVFIAVQRLVWFKNIPVLAGAFKEINDRGFNAILIVLGDDPASGKPEERKIRFVGAPNVFLLERKDNVADYLSVADCFCIVSSSFEGSPVALLEAISFGLPVIGTRIGGIPSTIKDPENGILCDPSPESVTRAIIRFIQMPAEEQSKIRQANSKLFSERYTEEIMIEQYASLISRIISRTK
jgi:glycosyltransferase involved in cell wall biosynthesis